MLKKSLIIAGILILLIALAIGGLVLWWKHQSAKYEATAVPYLKQTVPQIASWDKDLARTFMAPAALKGVSDEDFSKLFNWLKKLGALQKLDEPVLQNIFTGVNAEIGAGTVLTYLIHAQFEAGEGTITVRLQVDGAGFKYLQFSVNSKALMG